MGKIGCFLTMIVLALSSLMLSHGIAVDGGDEKPTRGDLSDPVDLSLQSFDDSLFPGQEETFYIYLYNDYDGSSFAGSTPPTNSSQIKEVKISFSGFFDEEGDPIVGGPANWLVGTIYNNNGDGYTMDRYDSRNFYADASNSWLEFRIKTDDIPTGDYRMGFNVDFRYMTDWDGGTQYDWQSSSVVEQISFSVNSYITGSYYPDYRFRAYEESLGFDDLYSGAKNKLFGAYNLYSGAGSVTDVNATISFPGSGITVAEPTTYNSNLPGKILWRIDVPEDTPAGYHDVELTLSYTAGGNQISEAPSLHEFMVKYTPVLKAPQSNDLDDPFLSFMRSDLPTSVAIPITNHGNVDMKQVKVNMDLDNTRYVDGSEYFINEESSGSVIEEDITSTTAEIPVGGTRTLEFNDISFFPRLPPGLYKIPLDYSGIYDDDGATGNTARKVTAGHWFENGHYEHRTIMRQISYPEDTSSDFRQFLLVEILPDPDGPMLRGYIDSGYNQDPGSVNSRMRLRVETLEMYEMRHLTYRIHTDGGSPLSMPFSSENETGGPTLPPILRAGLSESSGTYTQSDSFWFYANIREDAAPGINYFQVDVKGSDEFNQPFNTTFLAHISIDAHQPRFEAVAVEVGDIVSDRTVEVTVQMMNVGLGGAANLTCFFKSSSSGYVSMDPPVEVGSVSPGGLISHSFMFKPDGTRRYFSGTYFGNVYFSYYDDLGEFNELMSGSNLYIRFDIYDKLPDIEIVNVDAPLVDRGNEFDVTVKIMNMGGSEAMEMRAILPYSSSQFNVEDPEKELGDLAPGEEAEITYTIKAEEEINDRTTYSFTMHFSYTDILGRDRNYAESDSESFSVRTKDHIIPSEQRQIVEDDGVIVSEGAGSIILGIFILIAVIIFASMMNAGKVMDREREVNKDTKPRKAKTMVMEDDEEEEEEFEDEEEEEEEEEEDLEW